MVSNNGTSNRDNSISISNASEPRDSQLSASAFIGTVNNVKVDGSAKWMHTLHIQQSIIPVKIDTGAEADLLNYTDYLDASHAFWQLPIHEDCKDLTTFNTPYGRYAYDQLAYGICSAPEAFHKVME